MTKTTLTLDMKLPGTNQVIKTCKSSPVGYADDKKRHTKNVVQALIQGGCVPKKPYEHIRVNYVFNESGNPRDPDNVLMAMKYIHDAFICVGIVDDDDMWHISIGSIGMTAGNQKTSIEVSWEVCDR